MKIRVNDKKVIYTKKKIGQKRIVNFSDFHFKYGCRYVKRIDELFIKLKEIDPDLICIPGDFGDTLDDIVSGKEQVLDILYRLSKIADTTISFAAHDYFSQLGKEEGQQSLNAYFSELESLSSTLYPFFPNEHVSYELDRNFVAIGYSLPPEEDYHLENRKELLNFTRPFLESADLNDKNYNLFQCHSPNGLFDGFSVKPQSEIGSNRIRLVIAGHNHAALTPKFSESSKVGLVVPERLLPTCPYGMFKSETDEDYHIVISRGFLKMPGTIIREHGALGKLLYASNYIYRPDIDLVTVNGEAAPKQYALGRF